MATILLILLILAGVAFNALAIVAALRLVRWSKARHIRTSSKTTAALRKIPRAQVIAAYIAVGLVLGAAMAWPYATGWIATGGLVMGAVAMTYLVWFSFRWRHLR